jgi:hypothetical protein
MSAANDRHAMVSLTKFARSAISSLSERQLACLSVSSDDGAHLDLNQLSCSTNAATLRLAAIVQGLPIFIPADLVYLRRPPELRTYKLDTFPPQLQASLCSLQSPPAVDIWCPSLGTGLV